MACWSSMASGSTDCCCCQCCLPRSSAAAASVACLAHLLTRRCCCRLAKGLLMHVALLGCRSWYYFASLELVCTLAVHVQAWSRSWTS